MILSIQKGIVNKQTILVDYNIQKHPGPMEAYISRKDEVGSNRVI